MSADFETNANEVYDKFVKLSIKEMGQAVRTGIRKGLLFIRNDARRSFRALFPSGSKINSKYHDKLIDGIRATKVKDRGKDGYVGYVLITSNRRPGSGSYRLVFLEGGTTVRYTKKGYHRGSITASYFFTSTVQRDGSAYTNELVKTIDKTVDKINKKNLK